MRIIIDAQACQFGLPETIRKNLSLAVSIAQEAESHEVFVALNSKFSETIMPLRQSFSNVVPAEKIVVFDVPSLSSKEASLLESNVHAANIIRAGFFASFNPDFVISPYLIANGVPDNLHSIVPSFDSYLSVLLIDDSIISKLSQRDETFYRIQANLNRAALIITTSAKVYESLCSSIEIAPTQLLRNCPDTDAIWRALTESAMAHPAKEIGQIVQRRPRLAYVSPLPPEKSGIADYSAELLPELARYYEIELIIDQPLVDGSWVKASLPLRTVAWFDEHAETYDRIIYQLGNNHVHKHMFGLMERHPGIVVLHDFFLSNTFDNLDCSGYSSDAFVNALFYSHGITALVEKEKIGTNAVIWKYPCNKKIIDQAVGIIVHSQFSRQLANDWYGLNTSKDWRNIPLIRGHADDVISKKSTRHLLHFCETDFIVCSFGMMGVTKSNNLLIDAWLASPLANDPNCYLIFVGENAGGDYGREMSEKIARHPAGARIRITGFVAHEVYCSYLAAADAAVQLRLQTRGETSASVLDCLLHGLPTIVNAHGAVTELPDEILIKLDDVFSIEALNNALSRVWQSSTLRQELCEAARKYIKKHHSPDSVGKLYNDAIEHYTRTSAKRHYKKMLQEIRRAGITNTADLESAAMAIAANQPATASRQLLIDISALVQCDLKTGIQRVVRSILMALIDTPPAGFRIEPVYSPGRNESYRYASSYLQNNLGLMVPCNEDAPIETHAGDIFVGLDLFLSGTQQNKSLLQKYRNRGLHVYFVVYDILPVLLPEVFPEGTKADFSGWLTTIASVSDGLICISRSVANELTQWLSSNTASTSDQLKIRYFHLGADILASAPSQGLPEDAHQILSLIKEKPSILMVGTMEPRKGHAQALAAFELLWANGIEINLVIVGRQGWMIDEVLSKLREHPESGKRLFWLEGASDEMLLMLYENSSGLLAASLGEGFGLPLIEAAQHQLPIIARRLPVFQEVMGEHAYYFEGLTAQALASAVSTWIKLQQEGGIPRSDGAQWLTWEQSADQLLTQIFD